jgi:hypothetical protein
MLDINIVKSLLEGIMVGIVIAVLGYLKKVSDSGELPKFNSAKFAATIVIGGIAGALMRYYNISYDDASNILMTAGAVTLIEYSIKALYRYLKSKGHDVIPERKRLETEEADNVAVSYDNFLEEVEDFYALSLNSLDSEALKIKLNALADLYEKYLDEAEKKLRGFREVYLMDLSGHFFVKQKEIPKLLREGEFVKVHTLLRYLLYARGDR